MKTLFWLLLLGALAAGLSLAASSNDGYVLLVLPPWRIELSLNLLLVLAALAFVLVYWLVRSVNALIVLPSAVHEYRQRRARESVDESLRESIIMLMEGRYSRALRMAENVFEAGHVPLFAALVAEWAAHGMRDEERESLWRQKAREQDRDNSSGARQMLEASIAAENRDYATALERLNEFARSGGRHVAAQRLALRVHQGLGQWNEVERVVRQLEKHKAMTPEQAAPLRQRAQREQLAQLKDRDEAGAELARFLRKLPDSDRLDSRMALQAAPLLTAAGNHAEAARLIEDGLEAQWDSDLAAAYGDCDGDLLARMAHAERWLHAHPRDAKLLLTLGRLCRRQQLWGKAQSYLEASLSVQPSRRTHQELASLFDELGNTDQANLHYRAAAI